MKHAIHILINSLESISEWCGKIVSWCVLIMALIIGYDVFMRFVFHIGSVAIQELEWHLFAVLFLLSASYTLKHDGHVRVDIFYCSKRISDRQRALIDLLGTLLFLLPFSVLIIISSWEFVADSFVISEGSPDAGGLPYRFLLKSAIPLSFLLMIIQGFAIIAKCIDTLFLSSPNNSSSQGQSQ
jgi:TRAP-type mannitol/chloroaromatic compound transport system permease small subunit